MKTLTGLLQKALWCTVFGIQFSEKGVFYTVYCLLKTENLKFAKLHLILRDHLCKAYVYVLTAPCLGTMHRKGIGALPQGCFASLGDRNRFIVRSKARL